MDEPVFIDSREEMEQILQEEVLGYLGLEGDGQPYVVPLNYAYAAGKILFHCALTGRKLDAIRRNPRVCFTVGRQIGEVRDHTGAPCHIDSDSVVCYGWARLLDDLTDTGRRAERVQPPLPARGARHPSGAGGAVHGGRDQDCRDDRSAGTDRHRTYWRAAF